MKSLRYLPICFLAGVDGFAVYAPYMAMAVLLSHLLWARRRTLARLSDLPGLATAVGATT